MWIYEKKLEFPIDIKRTNPKLAKIIITQYGGPDGELGAALRYISQRFTMLTPEGIATLNDIGTEELAHMEMIGTICYQLTANATAKQMQDAGMEGYYVDHGKGIYPVDGSGTAFSAATFQSTGDPVTDLYENMAAEQKARTTYEYLLDLIDDPDVAGPIRFLREREIVHFQRFGETLRNVQDIYDSNHFFTFKKKSPYSCESSGI